jgi:predicted enzyme related to lactoylglutathione lyase
MVVRYLSTVIFVKEISCSRRFYEGVLHQKVDTDHGPNVGYESGFAIWQAEHAYPILYGSPLSDRSPQGRRNFELYFETEDLDAALAQVTEAGVQMVHPIYEQNWGMMLASLKRYLDN